MYLYLSIRDWVIKASNDFGQGREVWKIHSMVEIHYARGTLSGRSNATERGGELLNALVFKTLDISISKRALEDFSAKWIAERDSLRLRAPH